MLIEFSVENFRSFKEKQTLSLVASKDPTHEGNLIRGEKEDLIKVAALYGANASGKSNLVTALDFAADLIRDSATKMNPGEKIAGAVPFRLDTEWQDRPSSFEFVFFADGVRYEYGFSATARRVHDEWLIAYPKGRGQHWFERGFDPQTEKANWDFKHPLASDAKLLSEKTRDNSLALSSGANLNIEPLVQLYLWFVVNPLFFDLAHPTSWLTKATARYVKGNEKARDRVARLLRHADMGISGFDIVEHPVRLEDLPKGFRESMSDEDAMKAIKKLPTPIDIRCTHTTGAQGRDVTFDFETDESNGTKRFFALSGPLTNALDAGALVVVDELDCSMHPLLVRKVIELFQNPEANTKGAQLVFTTHDSSLMDQTLFRRDQIWFTEKNAEGATELFSLYDFKTDEGRPRVNEAFERRYLAGRYGAVPQFGPALEDAEL